MNVVRHTLLTIIQARNGFTKKCIVESYQEPTAIPVILVAIRKKIVDKIASVPLVG